MSDGGDNKGYIDTISWSRADIVPKLCHRYGASSGKDSRFLLNSSRAFSLDAGFVKSSTSCSMFWSQRSDHVSDMSPAHQRSLRSIGSTSFAGFKRALPVNSALGSAGVKSAFRECGSCHGVLIPRWPILAFYHRLCPGVKFVFSSSESPLVKQACLRFSVQVPPVSHSMHTAAADGT